MFHYNTAYFILLFSVRIEKVQKGGKYFSVRFFGPVDFSIKGTVMQIEKALVNDRLRVSKVSLKFRIVTI